MPPILTKPLLFFGIKHCGKSTLGHLTAQYFGVDFTDTDDELEKQYYLKNGCDLSTRDIFKQLGEKEFRIFEAETIHTIAKRHSEPRVTALGGGVPANPFVNPEDLKKFGMGVYINIDPQLAFSRIQRRGLPPFLATFADPYAEFLRINQQREIAYRRYADLVFHIDAEEPPTVVVEKLIQAILAELKP